MQKVIQVDRDPSALGRRVPLTQRDYWYSKRYIKKELLPLVGQRENTEFIDTIRKEYTKFRENLDSYAVG